MICLGNQHQHAARAFGKRCLGGVLLAASCITLYLDWSTLSVTNWTNTGQWALLTGAGLILVMHHPASQQSSNDTRENWRVAFAVLMAMIFAGVTYWRADALSSISQNEISAMQYQQLADLLEQHEHEARVHAWALAAFADHRVDQVEFSVLLQILAPAVR
jgi:hypothetical protein